ncbi:MAG: hypothetical protein WAK29_12750 [Terriglobales bacterium]
MIKAARSFFLAGMVLALAVPSFAQQSVFTNRSPEKTTTLLVDNFSKDASLNTTLWTASSTFLSNLAVAASSPAGKFVTPTLSFKPGCSCSGMQMTGLTIADTLTGVQSVSTFTPPFTAVIDVDPTEGTAYPFEIILANSSLSQYFTVTDSVYAGADSIWVDDPTTGALSSLGEQFTPPITPVFKHLYVITINVNTAGAASVTVYKGKNELGSLSSLQVGAGPFHLVLGQRIGAAATGSQVVDWQYVKVTSTTD